MKTLFNSTTLFALVLTTVTAAAGCDEAEQGEDFGAGAVELRPLDGIKFNSFAYGKDRGGEVDTSGALWDDSKLVKVELQCTKDRKQTWRYPQACHQASKFILDKVWAEHGELYGLRDGLIFRGADFLLSDWTIDLFTDGVFDETHVQSIRKYDFNPAQLPHALHFYTFMFMGNGVNGGEKGQWTAACSDNFDPVDGAAVPAQALVYEDISVDIKSGVISDRKHTLYFACIGAAVGKAGTWGYPAWDIGAEDFTGIVRSVRADYCGNGESWTKKGNSLQVEDVFGYNQFADPSSKTEAMWSHKGALCLGTPRWTGMYGYTDVLCNGDKLQSCDDAKLGDYPDAIAWTKLP